VVRLVGGLGLLLTLGACSQVFGLDEPIRATPDAPGGGTDTDTDGVPDSTDRCPLVADNQHDEDGDGIGDRCDNCPLEMNPDQDNADGDGLGDVCDSLTNAFDCTAHIGGVMTLDGWTPITGAWTVDNGDLVFEQAVGANSGIIISSTSYTKPYVVIGAQLTSIQADTLWGVDVWGQAMVNSFSSVDGVLAQVLDTEATPAALRLMLVRDGGSANIGMSQALAPDVQLAVGTTLGVSIDLRTGAVLGAGTSGASNAVVSTTIATTTASAPVALRAVNAGVRFRYVWIVVPGADPCPPPTQ
jgi:hypothetical protein